MQAASGFGANVSVNSASGVIARNLSNELKDLAAVAKAEQEVLHMFDWSDDERLGVQIGWCCCAVEIRRCEDNRHAESKMRVPVEVPEQSLEDQETQDSKALAKTKSEREEFVTTASTATESRPRCLDDMRTP